MLEQIFNAILANKIIFGVIAMFIILALGTKIMFKVAQASFYVVGIFAALRFLEVM